jgi:hypothetical protein
VRVMVLAGRALGTQDSLRKKRALYTINSMIVQKFSPDFLPGVS